MDTILFLVLLNIGVSNALLEQGLGPSVTDLIQQLNSTLNNEHIKLKQEQTQEKQQNQQEIAKLNNNEIIKNTQEIARLNRTISIYQQEILSLKQEVALLKGSSHKTVAFSGSLTHAITTLEDKQVIVYDRVLTNVGNGYNPSLGHFTAPVKGNYFISVDAMGRPNELLSLNIFKNGNAIEHIYTAGTGSSDYMSSNEIIIEPLEVGDIVWVAYSGGTRYIHCCNYNTFTVFLI